MASIPEAISASVNNELLIVIGCCFATKLTPELAKEIDGYIADSKDIKKYDGYVIFASPWKEYPFEGFKQYNSFEEIARIPKKCELFVFIVGVVKDENIIRFGGNVYYIARLFEDGDIDYYKEAKFLYHYDVRNVVFDKEPIWF